MDILALSDFPFKSFDKIRYSDTDRQGHVNNAVFNTYLETGRVEFLYDGENPFFDAGSTFVIAGLQLNFLQEIKWPGKVDIGTGVTRIGKSSIRMYQQIFQDDHCVASAETTIVHVDEQTGKSKPLSETSKTRLQALLLKV